MVRITAVTGLAGVTSALGAQIDVTDNPNISPLTAPLSRFFSPLLL